MRMMPIYLLCAANPKHWPFGQDVDSYCFSFQTREQMEIAYKETKHYHSDLFFWAFIIRPKLTGNS